MFNLIFQLGLIAVCGIFAFGWLRAIKIRDHRVEVLRGTLIDMASDFNALQAKYNELKEFNDLDSKLDFEEDDHIMELNGLISDMEEEDDNVIKSDI